MRRLSYFLLLFSLLGACKSPATDQSKNGPSPSVSSPYPFDRNIRLVFTRHARCRMDCRHITEKEIHEILDEGTINYTKSEPKARPDPRYAVEGYTAEQQHLRIIIAPEEKKLIVITCIEIGVEWSCHCN
jgi:hypothetical protein